MSTLTKIFVFLTLIFSLGVSVMVVITVSKQQPLHAQVEAEHRAMLAAQSDLLASKNDVAKLGGTIADQQKQITSLLSDKKLANDASAGKLATLEGDKAQLEAKLVSIQSSLNQTSAIAEALAKQNGSYADEIHRLSPENVRLVRENAELARSNNELQTAKTFAEQSIRKLQEQITTLTENAGKGGAATPSNDTGTVASLTVSTPTAPINGKISLVTPTAGRTLVELPLGTRDGVRKGTRFMVYRGQTYIADAVVEKPDPDVCVAAIDPASIQKGQTVQVGDMVMTGAAK